MNEQNVTDQTVLVTGGTQGIGKSIAAKFAYKGANTIIVGRNKKTGEKIARTMSGQVTYVQADLSQPEEVQRMIEQAVEKTGQLDVLVNNAGMQYEQTIEHTSVEDWDQVMNVNLRSVFLSSKYAIPHMRRQGGGKIINIASVDGYWVEPNLGAYCTAKGGVITLTKSIALDFARDGILCNCICPGYIETDMTDRYFKIDENPEETRRRLVESHPVQRLGKPEDVAEAAFWLATEETNFITGQSITVDGGLTLGNIGFHK